MDLSVNYIIAPNPYLDCKTSSDGRQDWKRFQRPYNAGNKNCFRCPISTPGYW